MTTSPTQTTLFAPPAPGDAQQKQRRKLTFRGNVKAGRHGWLRLTPAYSLHLVQEILEDRRRGDFVLDPFSGTATTPLASAIHGIPAHSVDVNPFLVWLGNLKVGAYPAESSTELERAANTCVSNVRQRKKWERAWVPDLHQIEKWWDEPVLETLSQLFATIGRVAKGAPNLRDLLRIGFCRAAIESSHASFNHQSMSFKKLTAKSQQILFDVSDQREAVFRAFLASIREIAASLASDAPAAPAEVFLGDSRNLDALNERQYTKVITSPPYPNRMSYIRELRPYMYWTGFLETGRQAGELDWQAIGGTWGCATSNLGKWESDPSENIPFQEFDRIVAAISEDHDLLGKYVHKYFQDIARHLRSLRRLLKPGARCYYIVGNSKFYGTLLPVELIYESLFKDLGYANTRVECIRKRNSKKELFEYIVYAEEPR